MDKLTILGILFAIFAIVGGQYFEGGSLHSLVNMPALCIVLGGTLGAVMLQNSVTTLKHACSMLIWILKPPKIEYDVLINKVVDWSKVVRKDGLLALQYYIDSEKDPYIQKGLGVLVDSGNINLLRRVMEVEIEASEFKDMKACHVFESMGAYCPTIGILGAVLGLIQVMNNLTEPDKLGLGIAVAFVATVYGVSFANLLFLPIAKKLKNIVEQKARGKELILEGMLSILEGENPRFIEAKLQGFLT